MSVNHRGLDGPKTEQLLHRANIVNLVQQPGGTTVPEAEPGRSLAPPRPVVIPKH
jgi:hypothetical protein